MGCDIHMTVQKHVDGAWVDAQGWTREHDYLQVEGGELYDGRNYSLFGFLAGVRREVDSPLAQGRGLPDGLGAEQLELHSDNHSPTHFTVAEVMSYDWTQSLDLEGWVEPRDFAKWKLRGKPDSYCGGVGGGRVQHVSHIDMQKFISRACERTPLKANASTDLQALLWAHGEEGQALDQAIQQEAFGSPYTLVQWSRPYYELCEEFLGQTLPRAWRIGTPEDVRFIVSFDS